MRFLHTVIDNEGNQVESIYSNNASYKLSLECLAKVVCGEYKIWNREDWTKIN